MILSDYWIRDEINRGNLVISPQPWDRAFQPASLELRLDQGCVLYQDAFWLACTLETVTVPSHLVAQVNGKSSLARLGLLVHATAGYIDPGFHGQITLELKNLGPNPLHLGTGDPICQLEFHEVRLPVLRPYGHPELGSHYQGQKGTTRSYMEES